MIPFKKIKNSNKIDFLFYFLLFFWLLNKKPFFKNNGLSTLELNLLLILKIIVSCFAAYYFTISNTVDYFNFNNEGFAQYQVLIKTPSSFFSDWINDVKNYGWGGLMNDSHSLWANIRFSLIYKLIAVVNLISKGNFYLNSMIFGTLVFYAQVCFFKVFNTIYSNQKLKIVISVFLLPSLLLYTSCFHKDGIILIGLAIICQHLFSIFNKTFAFTFKNIFFILYWRQQSFFRQWFLFVFVVIFYLVCF